MQHVISILGKQHANLQQLGKNDKHLILAPWYLVFQRKEDVGRYAGIVIYLSIFLLALMQNVLSKPLRQLAT